MYVGVCVCVCETQIVDFIEKVRITDGYCSRFVAAWTFIAYNCSLKAGML